ncbi:peptidoglycan-binding protein [Streptomyces sp. NPDC007861]|uniref:peptidoglycan-binding protein n=1 Tax=Streptomyces sp. NPDC007861 TaxID=3154893 RepID=UPI00340BF9F4
MGTAWIPGAERLGSGTIGGPMDHPDRPARVVWHTTESGAGPSAFHTVGNYLISVHSEPQVLYDPTTDRIGQYGPLTQSARALKNCGTVRNNRVGTACIQIEVLAHASQPFTAYWRPGPNFRALMAAIRSFGIPDGFPMGTPARSVAGCRREASVWLTRGGHYGHCHVPGNDHWDPGGIDPGKLFAAAPGTPPPGHTSATGGLAPGTAGYIPFPGTAFFQAGAHSPIVTAMGRKLVAEGCSAYTDGPGPQWGEGDRRSYALWQRKRGYSGSDADGIPGRTTWEALKVPKDWA